MKKIISSSWQGRKSRYNRKSWKARGPLVKGLRHRLFTAVTRVRIPYGLWVYCSRSWKKFEKAIDNEKKLWYTNIVVAHERIERQRPLKTEQDEPMCRALQHDVVVLNNEKNNKSVSDRNEWELKLLMRVWSWLRTNAGGVPNTCK